MLICILASFPLSSGGYLRAKREFMIRAIQMAKESAKRGDYAIGAVIVRDNTAIAMGTTNLKQENDPTSHAEIVAIRNACKRLKSHYLEGCVLYTTHEPCPMCTSAAIWAKMDGIVFGAYIKDAKGKSTKKYSWRQIDVPSRYVISKGTPKPKLKGGFLREECLKLFDLER